MDAPVLSKADELWIFVIMLGLLYLLYALDVGLASLTGGPWSMVRLELLRCVVFKMGVHLAMTTCRVFYGLVHGYRCSF